MLARASSLRASAKIGSLAAALALAAACGGATATTPGGGPSDGGPGGVTGAGGVVTSGGTTASGGAISGAGGAGAISGAGGAGGADCRGVRCKAPVCGSGVGTHVPPGECCPTCNVDCALVDCALPKCLPGQVLVTPAGQCCPRCTTEDGGAPLCESGSYAAFLSAQESALDALACATDADCAIVGLAGRCQLDCGTAVSVKASTSLSAVVVPWTETHCAGCPITDAACPPVVYTAVCQAGRCTRSP